MSNHPAIRILLAPIVLWLMISITFFLIRLAPGGPFSAERALPPEVEQALMERYHLDKPVLVQYGYYLGGLVKGDLGPSLKHQGRTVNDIVAEHLPVSFVLGCFALCVALVLGVSAGMISALKPRTPVDYVAMALAVLGISLPVFVIGPLLQMLFARSIKLFPVAGTGDLWHMVLPAFALGLPFAARFARLTRAGMLEVMNQNFIRTARSKGLRESTVILRHALRGGVLPVVSFLGPAIASITTGSLVVEQIFSIPGLGREFIQSALNRDYTLVLGTVVVYGTMIIFCNMLTDLSYAILDPRVRGGGGK